MIAAAARKIGHQVPAGVDLVPRHDRVGHLPRGRGCTPLRGRGTACTRRRAFRDRLGRRGALCRRLRGCLRRGRRDARQTDQDGERKMTDPEKWFLLTRIVLTL
jgi:hypothetical protein